VIPVHSEEFKSLLAKLRPVIGEMADAFWLAALLDPEREKDVKAVAQAMAAELLEESYIGRHILLEPPAEEHAWGEFPLGTVVYADRPVCRFGLRENDLPQHLLVVGRSGAGKTNVGYWLVWNLLKAGKPFIVLDWRRNYGHFLNRPEGKDIAAFRLGEDESLCFNPLDPPPNLDRSMREAYLRDIVSVICTSYLPGHHLLSTRGVEFFFLKALATLGSDATKPMTFNDVLEYVERYRTSSRETDWKSSALNVLLKLTTGPIGRLANSQGSTTLADILDGPGILELDSVGSQTDRSAFTQAFLLWLYYYRLAEGKSRTFKHAIIVEEAHNLFLRRADNEQSVHDLMLRQMRDLGEALVLLDQSPSLLSTPALGNTGVTICLNLKHADDVEAARKALTLPRENWEHIGRLPVGYAIVKLQDRWVKPFLVRFPRFPVCEHPEPSQPARSNLRSDSVEKSVEELRLAMNEAIRAIREEDRRETEEGKISMQERSLLVDIAEHPLAVVAERFKRLGWTPYTGTKVKRSLLEKHFIEQEKVRTPNGSVVLLKPTEEGRSLLATWGIKLKALPKNASLEHEYWKKLVAERYRAMGYTVEEEVPIGQGKAVDLVATKGDKRIAIEVETGKSDATANIHKCLEAGFDGVICITKTSALMERILSDLRRPPLSVHQRVEVLDMARIHQAFK
jgi:DNA-binding MarR family transcriptional regulator